MHVRWLKPGLAAAVGGGLSVALLRRGVVMGPDSWAYWEGSVSLLERREYAYFGGAPITAFPPLFPAFLALVQAVLGVSVGSLVSALALLAAIASFAWTALHDAVASPTAGRPADGLALLLIPATLAVSSQTLLSESLWLALLPVLLILLLARPGRGELGRLVAAGLILAGLLLTRNATVALLPGVALLLWRRAGTGSRLRRGVVAFLVIAGAAAPWLAIRARLGQLGAHAPSRGAHGPIEYSLQALAGLAYGLGPDRWGIGAALLAALLALLAWEAVRPAAGNGTRAAALAQFAALGLAGHVALFSVTFVAEPIRGRFVVFATLSLAVAALALAARRSAFLALGAALTAVALLRAGVKVRLAGVEQPVVARDVRISSRYPSGPPRPVPGGLLVAPPTYPWIPHR